MPPPQVAASMTTTMAWRWRPIIRNLLPETRHQRSHTRRRPALHGQRTGRFDIDTVAGSQRYIIAATSPSDGDPPMNDKDGGLIGLGGIDGPLRAAHRGHRLPRDNLK